MLITNADANELDRFIQTELDSSLLQSWAWGEFQKKVGRKIARIGLKKDGRLVAAALIIKHDLPYGFSYAYVPRGPVVLGQSRKEIDPQILKQIIEEIKRIAQNWKALFLRIDPPVSLDQKNIYQQFGFKNGANQIQARTTALINLEQPREQILAQMKSKTRYNIRLALKKEVNIRETIQAKDVEMFLQIYKQTTQRDRFIAHEDNYYRQQVEILGRRGMLKMFVAEYHGRPLANIMVAFFGKTATYLHGASSDEERNRMPTFAVQWEAIKEAQRLGLKWYDFNGAAPDDDPKHPWAGITRFKLGFGARRVEYLGALDLPLRPLFYWPYKMYLSLRPSDGR